jgi:hypothetical protein
MNIKSLVLILIILNIIIVFSYGYEFTIAVDKSSKNGNGEKSGMLEGVSSSSGSQERIESNTIDPIIIKKYMLPGKNRSYISGDRARIFVEIKNNKKNTIFRNISSIGISELVDDDLGILPDTAKWEIVNSITELHDFKSNLFRERTNLSENADKYSNCPSVIKYYKLFSINNSVNLSKTEQKKISEILNYYFDVNWINKNDVIFNNDGNRLIIKNSKNNSIEIIMDEFGSAKMTMSDGRNYAFKIKNVNGNKEIYDFNSIINFIAEDVPPKGSIIYFYDIKPKKSGTFNTETVVRLYDSSFMHLPDISSIIPIEIKDSVPDFKVSPNPNKLVSICGNPTRLFHPGWIEIKYDITYIGGASEPICRDVVIEFDEPENDSFYYVDEYGFRKDSLCNGSCFSNFSNFYKYETKEIRMKVVYPSVGIYSLPGIWINGVHYTFENEQISVESFFERNMQYFLLILAFVSLIVTAVEIHITRDTIHSARASNSTESGNSTETNKSKGSIFDEKLCEIGITNPIYRLIIMYIGILVCVLGFIIIILGLISPS